MGLLTPTLADPGPLMWMAQALQARLQIVFPPAYFQFAFMPAKPDRRWFERLLQRTPAVALGWNGSVAEGDDGGVWTAHAHWTVALITKNAAGPLSRYMGDAMAPGLFAMQRAATVALHGWLINPDGVDWCAAATAMVTAAGNLYNDDWGSEDAAICGLDLSVLYQETQPPGLEPNLPDGALLAAVAWNFGEQPPLLATNIQTGAS